MKWFDAGSEAVGFVAIGQRATGIIAIGQLSTGVIAVGQLARGVFVVGQLAVGVMAFGQACLALAHGGGMLGLAGLRTTPSLLVWGLVGEGHLRSNGRWRPTARWHRTSGPVSGVVRMTALFAVGVCVVLIGLSWIPDFPDEPEGPPPTTLAPASR